jgi:hypothetical protein
MNNTKKCTKCNIQKPFDDFYWLWLDKSDYFFVIPENALIEQYIIKTQKDNIDKKYSKFIYIKPNENDKEKYWYRFN